ncbi:MAG: TPM domain-containing protein [Alphaproteobacteria bacterium]|nr:TPM domain-containing protein [Alphaproteobacteria bacterium]
MKKLLFFFCLLLSFQARAVDFPALSGRVVDEAKILTPQQKNALEQILESSEPRQVVAVSLKSLRGYEIEEYGIKLGRHWQIGRKGVNDGVLVIIAPNERQLRIEVGYGLEGLLTDLQSYRITHNIMLPLAKRGQYAESLVAGSKAVIEVLQKSPSQKDEDIDVELILILSVFFTAIFNDVLRLIIKDRYTKKPAANWTLFLSENVLLNNVVAMAVVYYLSMMFGFWGAFWWLTGAVLAMLNYKNVRLVLHRPQYPYQRQWPTGWILGNRAYVRGRGRRATPFRGRGGSFGGGGASSRW